VDCRHAHSRRRHSLLFDSQGKAVRGRPRKTNRVQLLEPEGTWRGSNIEGLTKPMAPRFGLPNASCLVIDQNPRPACPCLIAPMAVGWTLSHLFDYGHVYGLFKR